MFKKTIVSAICVSFVGSAAFAQTAPVITAAPAPAPAGVKKSTIVVADLAYIADESVAGKYRLQELIKIGQKMDAELAPLKKQVEDQEKSLAALKDGLDAMASGISAAGGTPESNPEFLKKLSDFQTKRKDYTKLAQDLATKVQLAKRDLQATDEVSSRELLKALMDPVKEVMAAHGSEAMLETTVVAYSIPGTDVTDELMAKFNAKVKTVPVVRVSIPQQPAPGTPGADTKPKPADGAPLPKKPAAPPKN